MAKYNGVVTLDDGEIPVNVEFDNGHVRMSSSGTEIGQWPTEECSIEPRDDATFTISAENETLSFVPDQPDQFAAALTSSQAQPDDPVAPEEAVSPTARILEAPPPRPLTMVGFYALCALTAALAIWSLVTLFV